MTRPDSCQRLLPSGCNRRWLDSTRLIPAITLSDCRRRLLDPTRSDRLPMSHFQHGSNFHKGTTTRTSSRGIQLDCNRTNQCQGIAIPTIKLLSTNYKRTNDHMDLDSAQSIAYSTYSMMASNDFLARKLNYKQTKRRNMVYWKVGTDIWEPRNSVKHFSSLSWCISFPQAENASSVQWQVLQTATKYSFGLFWCCCFTEEDIVLKNIEDLALDASTETLDSWQHVYRRRGRPDQGFSQSLGHRLNSVLVSSWTEMHHVHIKYDPMSVFSACDNPKTANMNNQFFFSNFLAESWANWMHRLWNETREEPRSEEQGSHRKIKELQYRSN